MIKPEDINLKELDDRGICTECGAIIHHTAHYCEFCKLRVSVPIEIEPIVLFFKQFLADKLNRIEKKKILVADNTPMILIKSGEYVKLSDIRREFTGK